MLKHSKDLSIAVNLFKGLIGILAFFHLSQLRQWEIFNQPSIAKWG